jgi:hypothetical protein
VLGNVVLKLYQASLDMKYVPQRWRTAKIVVLRKPNKPDYSKPKAYRPISLLHRKHDSSKASMCYVFAQKLSVSRDAPGGRLRALLFCLAVPNRLGTTLPSLSIQH